LPADIRLDGCVIRARVVIRRLQTQQRLHLIRAEPFPIRIPTLDLEPVRSILDSVVRVFDVENGLACLDELLVRRAPVSRALFVDCVVNHGQNGWENVLCVFNAKAHAKAMCHIRKLPYELDGVGLTNWRTEATTKSAIIIENIYK
jgi:hypothetical protein